MLSRFLSGMFSGSISHLRFPLEAQSLDERGDHSVASSGNLEIKPQEVQD